MGRDPIEEQGGLNLYGFCGNNGVSRWDVLGMITITDPEEIRKFMEELEDQESDDQRVARRIGEISQLLHEPLEGKGATEAVTALTSEEIAQPSHSVSA